LGEPAWRAGREQAQAGERSADVHAAQQANCSPLIELSKHTGRGGFGRPLLLQNLGSGGNAAHAS
jgi:hypothetical protein